MKHILKIEELRAALANGDTDAQIAQLLNIKEGSVRVTIYRIKKDGHALPDRPTDTKAAARWHPSTEDAVKIASLGASASLLQVCLALGWDCAPSTAKSRLALLRRAFPSTTPKLKVGRKRVISN